MVELVAHPRLLDRPEIQTFIRLHEAVAREIAHRRYRDRDAKDCGDGVDYCAAEVGVGRRTGDVIVDVVGT